MQYFGNVVTCYWWDEIWLNEGPAIFYEILAMQEFEPDMGYVRHILLCSCQMKFVPYGHSNESDSSHA